jgi:hypothetical protein
MHAFFTTKNMQGKRKRELIFYLCNGEDKQELPRQNLDMLQVLDTSVIFCSDPDHLHTQTTCQRVSGVQGLNFDTVTFFCTFNVYTPNVDLVKVAYLRDYFCANSEMCEQFLTVATQVLDSPTASAKEKLNAFLLTNQKQNAKQPKSSEIVALSDHYPLYTKAKYCMVNDQPHTAFPPVLMTTVHVAETLQIPHSILTILSADKVVIAGGAALQLGCPKSTTLPSSDVDIFILQDDDPTKFQLAFTQILTNEGYWVCRNSPSTLTAIGTFTRRRIQLVHSTATTSLELIRNFDLNAVKACFDGTHLHSLACANFDWITMKCSQGQHVHIKPKRLAKLTLKGFAINKQTQKYLHLTIGWPLSTKIKNNLMYNIPALTPELPREIQQQQLIRMHMIHPTIEAGAPLRTLGNAYGPNGDFDYHTHSPDEFVQHLEKTRHAGTRSVFYTCKFRLKFPKCKVPFQVKDQLVNHRRFKITMFDKDHPFAAVHDAINNDTSTIATSLYMDLGVSVNDKTRWYLKGVPLEDEPEVLQINTAIQVFGFPLIKTLHASVRYILTDVFIL